MCGRVILTLSAKMIREILNNELDINNLDIDDFVPRYNIGPGQNLLTIIQHKTQNRAGYINWQYLPDWTNDPKDAYKFINARSETIDEKISFKDNFTSKRCLILVNGFYEWDKNKNPYLFHHDFEAFTLGGIWNARTINGEKKYGLSIITTKANQVMESIHHRMPLIIQESNHQMWLNKETHITDLKKMMTPLKDNYLRKVPVSKHVNNIKNDDPICIEKIN